MPSSGSGAASGILSGVTYPDIEAWVYWLLPDADAGVVTAFVADVVAKLLTYPCFTTYEALTATQKVWFDNAVGYKAAWLIYNRPSQTQGSGEIKSREQDGLKVTYDVGTTTRSTGVAGWLTEYEKALAIICPEALIDPSRRARSSSPVSTLPNSFDPRDSLYPSDVERAAEAEVV